MDADAGFSRRARLTPRRCDAQQSSHMLKVEPRDHAGETSYVLAAAIRMVWARPHCEHRGVHHGSVGNSISFGNRFVGALASAIVVAVVFGTLVYFGYGSVSM
jgi:hypothetical protein